MLLSLQRTKTNNTPDPNLLNFLFLLELGESLRVSFPGHSPVFRIIKLRIQEKGGEEGKENMSFRVRVLSSQLPFLSRLAPSGCEQGEASTFHSPGPGKRRAGRAFPDAALLLLIFSLQKGDLPLLYRDVRRKTKMV